MLLASFSKCLYISCTNSPVDKFVWLRRGTISLVSLVWLCEYSVLLLSLLNEKVQKISSSRAVNWQKYQTLNTFKEFDTAWVLGVVIFIYCRREIPLKRNGNVILGDSIAWHQVIYLDAPVRVCECVCVCLHNEILLLALQLSVQRAVHLHFTTHLTNVPTVTLKTTESGQIPLRCAPVTCSCGGFLSIFIATSLCIIMNNQFI